MSTIGFSAMYFTLSLASFALASMSSPCYYPDGSLRSNDVPCLPDLAESFCCGQGHSCMSNGLCRWPDDEMTPPIAYVRGSCTDKSWKSSACPQYCEKTAPDWYSLLITCPNSDFCCAAENYPNQGCCSASASLFEVAVATTVTVIGIPTSTSQGSHPSSATATLKSTNHSNLGIDVGAGVGVGVFAVLLVLIGGWLFRRRRKHSTISQAQGSAEERVEYKAELPSQECYDGSRKGFNLSYGERNGRQELDGQRRQELSG